MRHNPTLLTDHLRPFQVLLKNTPQPFINAMTKRKTIFGSHENNRKPFYHALIAFRIAMD